MSNKDSPPPKAAIEQVHLPELTARLAHAQESTKQGKHTGSPLRSLAPCRDTVPHPRACSGLATLARASAQAVLSPGLSSPTVPLWHGQELFLAFSALKKSRSLTSPTSVGHNYSKLLSQTFSKSKQRWVSPSTVTLISQIYRRCKNDSIVGFLWTCS